MYKDVRAAVDLCHRDGTLKQMVAKDPGRYEYNHHPIKVRSEQIIIMQATGIRIPMS
jgi:hypothetical protein